MAWFEVLYSASLDAHNKGALDGLLAIEAQTYAEAENKALEALCGLKLIASVAITEITKKPPSTLWAGHWVTLSGNVPFDMLDAVEKSRLTGEDYG